MRITYAVGSNKVSSSSCPDQGIERPFIFTGPKTGPCSYFGPVWGLKTLVGSMQSHAEPCHGKDGDHVLSCRHCANVGVLVAHSGLLLFGGSFQGR
jgi:hypothetical protein